MSDARWMANALSMARRALGQTWPNPAVGAVIVRDGKVLGRGATSPTGRPHAETNAISHALQNHSDCAGATAYVTLEPCAHQGKTPPCADALIAAGIQRVVSPITDPDPRVAGRGFARLRDAGVQVDVGLLATDARQVNIGFLSRLERSRPHVQLKLATTLDGRIATVTGESRWITGPAARRFVHLMRASADAVLVGAGTARDDDPMLDVRDLGLADRSPVRIVVDGALSIDPESRLAQSAERMPLWLLHREDAGADRQSTLSTLGAELIPVPEVDGVIDLGAALQTLATERGITRLMCEGGGHLAASLLAADLVDEIVMFQAGKLIGADGRPAIQSVGLTKLADAAQFAMRGLRAIGRDTVSIWQRQA